MTTDTLRQSTYAALGRMIKLTTNPASSPAVKQWAEEEGRKALLTITVMGA